MKLSARNVVKGKVKSVDVGVVNVEVCIEVAPGIEFASIVTKKSADKLGLAVGKEAYVVVKASNVMVAVD